MTEKPILFNAHMVRALLDGTKTQTRIIFKPERITFEDNGRYTTHAVRNGELTMTGQGLFAPDEWLHYCPYGQPGDQLWVREKWRGVFNIPPPGPDQYAVARYIPDQEHCSRVEYAATMVKDKDQWRLWRPSIHMPRWASRINLEITGVRVERLQDISEADAQAEGCLPLTWEGKPSLADLINWPLKTVDRPYANDYAVLWESINGPGSWDANPWVWVVEFARHNA